MFKVVMSGLFETAYTVCREVSLLDATQMVEYLYDTCKPRYFDNLFISQISVIDMCTGEVMESIKVGVCG